ncbi:hypothetical protein FHS39_002556 [Streptomyces olivoverticillatus]|uniref:Phosphodiester glycosidase domain-containing protein n=1 Tax=Streptomyces olivoverticillatus TaxID=66427 RepID=A0A7W7PM79_9ACTN|nr:hypothetical protein [Streptomyces olivoverticillatus]MBB4893525.1 hypothetical protein [Streptomyces olivoverticillatus]
MIEAGRFVSLPVVDGEAVLCKGGALSMEYVPARGRLVLNGVLLPWAGSRTGRPAECFVYGNGNAAISRRQHPVTGSERVLDEGSRLTPAMSPRDGWVDIGCRATRGVFVSTDWSAVGGLDIFASDLVLRCPAGLVPRDSRSVVRVLNAGPLDADVLPDAAVSVGPSLGLADFGNHPVNRDPSLGDVPPFADRRLARIALFQDVEGRMHLCLFDGRPGSRVFPGVTASEARRAIAAHSRFAWGCFLDGGQTAKLVAAEGDSVVGHGNRHYLRWPEDGAGGFVWVPDEGRPVASAITVGLR